jgi:hypothetical protein
MVMPGIVPKWKKTGKINQWLIMAWLVKKDTRIRRTVKKANARAAHVMVPKTWEGKEVYVKPISERQPARRHDANGRADAVVPE